MLLVHDDALTRYRLSPSHPMQPERFSLAVELLQEWRSAPSPSSRWDAEISLGLPSRCTDSDLALAHSPEYVAFVKNASNAPFATAGYGIGMGDTPAFTGMHEAAAMAVGASCKALDAVLAGEYTRSVNLAGGLHHAAYDHASGFCIYNDVVVAIRRALASADDLRIAYVDIDAHHGDGVEQAFRAEPRVLTISVHESGRYLFPGTGDATDGGEGPGLGTVMNIPLPMGAGPESYMLAWSGACLPALEAFAPDLVVLQGGADSHRNDPLTHLAQTCEGYAHLVADIATATEKLCEGRAVLLGGGGYRTFDEVPRMWAAAVCIWAGLDVPTELPERWTQRTWEVAAEHGSAGCAVKCTLAEEGLVPAEHESVTRATARSVDAARASSVLLEGSAAGSSDSLEEQLADLIDRELDAGF